MGPEKHRKQRPAVRRGERPQVSSARLIKSSSCRDSRLQKCVGNLPGHHVHQQEIP